MYTVHPPRLTFTHLEGHWRRTRSVERESERERGQFSVYYQLYKITFSTVIATELIRDIQFIHHNSTLPVVERKRKKNIYLHTPSFGIYDSYICRHPANFKNNKWYSTFTLENEKEYIYTIKSVSHNQTLKKSSPSHEEVKPPRQGYFLTFSGRPENMWVILLHFRSTFVIKVAINCSLWD